MTSLNDDEGMVLGGLIQRSRQGVYSAGIPDWPLERWMEAIESLRARGYDIEEPVKGGFVIKEEGLPTLWVSDTPGHKVIGDHGHTYPPDHVMPIVVSFVGINGKAVRVTFDPRDATVNIKGLLPESVPA